MIITMTTPVGDRHNIDPATFDMEILWEGGWKITAAAVTSVADRSQLNELLSRERAYQRRQQPRPTITREELELYQSSFNTPLARSLFDLYAIDPAKDGDSQKTAPTSSKAKNTFKAFIQRTTNTA